MELEFEFDPVKSALNLQKHGIDLQQAQRLWHDQDFIRGPGQSTTESRWLAVGMIDGLHWTTCFTYRGPRIRLIECRRARREEREVYEHGK
ncbi:MAG: BrnT family toxin [Proteobacteria bacterium]|nr:BrnT family toxin [Pseudomonadota bacterium]